ncbi:MAG TPA: Hpt domain-containing protein [Rhizomicrobium sp.]|nr:Hpt domain-containing protein [Rhizomicrobium sp.]
MSLSRPVDLVHLAKYTGGDRVVNAEVLSLFLNQSIEILEKLGQALREGNAKVWREVIHSLKGGARGIGAFQLADEAAKAENTDPAADQSQAARALAEIQSRALAVNVFIKAYLGH